MKMTSSIHFFTFVVVVGAVLVGKGEAMSNEHCSEIGGTVCQSISFCLIRGKPTNSFEEATKQCTSVGAHLVPEKRHLYNATIECLGYAVSPPFNVWVHNNMSSNADGCRLLTVTSEGTFQTKDICSSKSNARTLCSVHLS